MSHAQPTDSAGNHFEKKNFATRLPIVAKNLKGPCLGVGVNIASSCSDAQKIIFVLRGLVAVVLEGCQIPPHVEGLGNTKARQTHIPSTRSIAESVDPPEIGFP